MADSPSGGGYRAAGAAEGPFGRRRWLQSAMVAGLAAVARNLHSDRGGGMEGLVVSVVAPPVRSGLPVQPTMVVISFIGGGQSEAGCSDLGIRHLVPAVSRGE